MGPSILKPLKDVEVVKGKPLELTCEVNGTPRPTAVWYKGEEPINAGDERIKTSSTENVHSLRIESADEKIDNCLFKVKFTNEFGSSETKSNVSVLSNLIFNIY